jgi:transcriptional regulator with XRE-family HTH domain
MLTRMNDFIGWLSSELDRHGWSNNELGRRAGLSSGGISVVMTGRQNPGFDFCIKVARALGLPPEFVLRRASLLPALPSTVAEEEEALYIFRSLPSQARGAALSMLRGLAKEAGVAPPEDKEPPEDEDSGDEGDE